MTLKRRNLSVKVCRRLSRMAARVRLSEITRAGWLKRYKLTRTCR